MNRHTPGLMLAILLMIAAESLAVASQPELGPCYAVTATTTPVSIYSLPGQGGDPLTSALLFGGALTDATITVTVVDIFMDPWPFFPAEDIWLEADGCSRCPAGSIADHSTEWNGETTITGPVGFGGAIDPDGIRWANVFVNGEPILQPGFDIRFNSPDLNGDLRVDLTDVVLFAGDYFGAYHYRSDFHWDGVLNLADVVLMARGWGSVCP